MLLDEGSRMVQNSLQKEEKLFPHGELFSSRASSAQFGVLPGLIRPVLPGLILRLAG